MMFLVIAIANTAIGTFQEIRSSGRWTADSGGRAAGQGHSRRRTDRGSPLAPGRDDIIELSAGDQICADAVVRSGEMQVNESLITGRPTPSSKAGADTLKSFVVAGRGHEGSLTQVGPDAYAAKLSAGAKKNVHATESEMMRSLDRLIRVVGFALIPVGCVLFTASFRCWAWTFKPQRNPQSPRSSA